MEDKDIIVLVKGVTYSMRRSLLKELKEEPDLSKRVEMILNHPGTKKLE